MTSSSILAAATCAPPCQNGGSCVSPDSCVCSQGWIGPDCSHRKLDQQSCHMSVSNSYVHTHCLVSLCVYNMQKYVLLVLSRLAPPLPWALDPLLVAPADTSWSTATVKVWTRWWQTSVAWNPLSALAFTLLSLSHRALCDF